MYKAPPLAPPQQGGELYDLKMDFFKIEKFINQ